MRTESSILLLNMCCAISIGDSRTCCYHDNLRTHSVYALTDMTVVSTISQADEHTCIIAMRKGVG
jgi:hypothetical protein